MARKRDQPLFACSATTLLAIAVPPTVIGDLTRIAGPTPRPIPVGERPDRRGAARLCPETDRPDARRCEGTAPTGGGGGIAPSASGATSRADAELDPSVLASRGVVEEMAKRWEAGIDPWETAELRRWQTALLRPVLV
jgi:hypothetical protein